MRRLRLFTALAVLPLSAFCAIAPQAPQAQIQNAANDPADSSAVVAVIARFHARLEAGDSTGALALLAPEARILEGGEIETYAEYASHHLASDIAAVQALDGSQTIRQVTVAGNVAWVVSSSTSRGTWRGRTVDSQGAELMVLRRNGAAWQIAAIHWSSHQRRPARP